MAEGQASHRQEMEKIDLIGSQWVVLRGQVFGFIIGMTTIVGTLFLIYAGHQGWGLAGLISSIAILAGVFIVDKKTQAKDNSAELSAPPPPADDEGGPGGQAP